MFLEAYNSTPIIPPNQSGNSHPLSLNINALRHIFKANCYIYYGGIITVFLLHNLEL